MSFLRVFNRVFYGLAGSALCAVSLAACGGTTKDPGTSPSPSNVVSGGSCSVEGQSSPAADGCNKCSCSGGAWSCTKIACITEDGGAHSTCTPGLSPDGCNQCTCLDGKRVCTERACLPEPVCKDGDTQKQDCNTCTCMGGQWGCTTIKCLPVECQPGEFKGDRCNTCSCANGQWACTERYCPPADAGSGNEKSCGARLGNTCSSTEYCAYTPGEYCGTADASSTCKTRPTACDNIYAPVCGCDSKTYSNDCEAAAAGTGVLSAGACK